MTKPEPGRLTTHKTSVAELALPFVVGALALALDQGIKRWVEANLQVSQSIYPVQFLEPYLGFTHAQNSGVAFSLFQGLGNVVVLVGIIVCILIAVYALRLPAGSRAVRIGLGLILGGALGNIVDRVRQGYVTDMIHFRIPQIGFDWPVSNFADVFIFLGVCILISASVWPNRTSDEQAALAVAMPAQQEWHNGQ
jgi:signal peptidase II